MQLNSNLHVEFEFKFGFSQLVPALLLLQGLEDVKLLSFSLTEELWSELLPLPGSEFDAAYDAVRRPWCCTETGKSITVSLQDKEFDPSLVDPVES